MSKDIGGVDDMPNFDGIKPPTIDPTAQSWVDAANDAFDASLGILSKSFKEAEDARQELLSWAALADKVLSMVMPIITRELERRNVPDAATEAPRRWQTLVPQLLGVAALPVEQRPAAIGNIIAGL